jgi:16S rRNA (guanine527-N7)-methyltransferase
MQFLALLQKWNRAYNLTGLNDLNDMAVRHILDPATARPFLRGDFVLDAGTGAGLPGIPLALLEPDRQFTLVDSVGKKIHFLRQAVAELAIPNVELAQVRLETFKPERPFDTVICRALTTLQVFTQLCGRLVGPAGRLVAMKGRHPASEISEVPAPWRVIDVERVIVPGLEAERHLVVLER